MEQREDISYIGRYHSDENADDKNKGDDHSDSADSDGKRMVVVLVHFPIV